MTDIQLQAILSIVKDLPYYEWCKIRHCVDKAYDAVQNKAVLSDTASLKAFLHQEIG